MLPALELSPRATIAPSLVVTSRLLGCNLTELSQRLLIEAANNPALQLLAVQSCPRCGFPLNEDNKCLFCARQPYQSLSAPEPSTNWEELLPAPEDFRHELLSEARLVLDRADYALAEFIIAALDEHGLLSSNILQNTTLPQRAEHVLHVIQSLDPPGIAARDTAECFHLQLQRLDVSIPQAVHRLIEQWASAPQGEPALARKLGITLDELKKTFEFISKHLTPYPIMDAPDILPYRHVDVAIIHTPDSEIQFEIIIAPGPRVRASDDPAMLGEADFSPDDWRSLAQHAQLVNRALHNREQIMEQIFSLVAQKQAAYC